MGGVNGCVRVSPTKSSSEMSTERTYPTCTYLRYKDVVRLEWCKESTYKSLARGFVSYRGDEHE